MKKASKWIFVAFATVCAIALAGCKNSSEPDPVAVESVTLEPASLALAIGTTGKLTAKVTPDDADDKTVAWYSSDEKVAVVSADGTVAAVAEGTATITARAGRKEAACEITVKLSLVPVESVTLEPASLSLESGTTAKLAAKVTPENADNKTVAWSSSDEKVAVVSADGTVAAVAEGTATITARAGGKTATCAVTVSKPATEPAKPVEHIHYYREGKCTVCGFTKPVMEGGTIDDEGVLTKYEGDAAEVVIPEGVRKIASGMFYNNTTLTSVTIPASVRSIGSSDDEADSGVFGGCTNLKSVTIGAGMKSIGKWAFWKCASLTEVNYTGTLADWCDIDCGSASANPLYNGAVLYIDGKAVTDVEIPGGVTKINACAFSGCTSLESVTMGAGVKIIGENAFWDCTKLTSVTIGDGVENIEYHAFYGCKKLTSITYKGTTDQWRGMSREYNWNGDTGNYTIQCTDGTVAKNGTVTKKE